MSVKLLTEYNLELVREAAQAPLSLHLSKCHIVGNHMPRLNYDNETDGGHTISMARQPY